MMIDPTYVKEEIEENPEWRIAFSISEAINGEAPIGWSKFIWTAKVLLSNYEIKRKGKEEKQFSRIFIDLLCEYSRDRPISNHEASMVFADFIKWLDNKEKTAGRQPVDLIKENEDVTYQD